VPGEEPDPILSALKDPARVGVDWKHLQNTQYTKPYLHELLCNTMTLYLLFVCVYVTYDGSTLKCKPTAE